jgi:hypothetical protein
MNVLVVALISGLDIPNLQLHFLQRWRTFIL